MDNLSYFIKKNHISTTILKNCEMKNIWSIPHEVSSERLITWHLVEEGELILDVPGYDSEIINSGTIIFLPQYNAHRLRYNPEVKDLTTTILCGMIKLGPGSELFFDHLPAKMCIDEISAKPIKPNAFPRLTMLDAVVHEFNASLNGSDILIEYFVTSLFVMALRNCTLSNNQFTLFDALLNSRISAVIKVMYDEPSKNWTVDSLAKVANMSRATFARHFKQEVGTTPQKALTYIRMGVASRLLNNQRVKIIDVAISSGFSSESSFHKAFSKHFNMTPKQYQNKALEYSR